MVLQKRLEYGFYGYQVPPVPRAPRSARKRISSVKKSEEQNRMCAFDLLATVAGKLLLEGDDSANKINREDTKVVNESAIKIEDDSLKANVYDQDSCNKSFFVSEIIKGPITDTYSGPTFGRTVSDCKVEDINNKQITNEAPNNGKPPLVDNVDCNLNLVIRDDDENSCGCTHKTFRPPPRIGDRRIRRLSASKHWKATPNTDVYRNKKSFHNYQRSLRDYPFKKRRMYRLDDHNLSNSNDNSGSVEDGSILGTTDHDSHVKLKIKSFRVPEFFIEIPETATVSSLKRTVMEAVTAIFSGEVHVGVMLQGKRIRDDNKTLLQTGICHDNKLDALGFTLEPNEEQLPPFICHDNKLDALGFTLEPNEKQLPPFICPEDRSVVSPPATPKPLTRYFPPQTLANQLVIRHKVPDSLPDSLMTNSRNIMENDRDMSVDSRALVTVPAMNTSALTVVPVRKSKRVEVGQRRIRRPFSVSEVEALVEAVERLGTGRWRDVKLRAFDDAKHRTYVDLKDKWKTLVHTARISPQQRRGEPVPQELLDRVLTAHGYWSHHQAKNQFKHQLQTETCRLF